MGNSPRNGCGVRRRVGVVNCELMNSHTELLLDLESMESSTKLVGDRIVGADLDETVAVEPHTNLDRVRIAFDGRQVIELDLTEDVAFGWWSAIVSLDNCDMGRGLAAGP